jgi:hypothetical protein
MNLFKISEYGDEGEILLTKYKNAEEGHLTSSTIFMNKNEINDLIKVLQDYANENGNI